MMAPTLGVSREVQTTRLANSPLARRFRRAWLIFGIIYFVALTIGTHWPRLDLGTKDYPATDKMMHLYAFAGLTVLIWLSGLVHRRMLLWLMLAVWLVIDECTQLTFVPGREFSWKDVIAGELGVAVAIVWLWATRPLGVHGGPNRTRLSLQRLAFMRMFAGRQWWIGWLIFLVATIPTGLALIFAWPHVLHTLPDLKLGGMYGIAQALWLGGLLMVFLSCWSREMRCIRRESHCPVCGTSTTDIESRDEGNFECRSCSESLHRGMWIDLPPPSGMQVRQMGMAPAIFGIGTIIAVMILFAIGVRFYAAIMSSRLANVTGQTMRTMNQWPIDFVMTIDLSVLLLVFGIVVVMYRKRLAAWHDQQGRICLRCEYDVSHTSADRGIGRCPECGQHFVRAS